jgi:hypothetical protein
MGGFRLIGPTHTIRSTSPILCRCLGYRGKIDQNVQNFLINKDTYVLDLSELPTDLRDRMQLEHLPTDMSYAIEPNPIDQPYTPPVYNPNMW